MTYKSIILTVDDEPSARDTLEALLFMEGYDLAFASNGAEALKKAAELAPDLILLDVMMPGMDGFEVCRRLRADPLLADAPVIMITALDDRDSRLRGIESGANDFVSKPFDRVELRARVRTITSLNRRRRLRTLELQAERDRTRSILEALGEAVVVTDLEGVIQYVNPATVALTGFTGEELLGQSWQLWRSDQQPVDFSAQMKIPIVGQAWRGEVINKRKDGALYDAMLTIATLFDPHNPDRPAGFVSVQRDISPLKEAERLKDRFVSNVSHELSTPLSVITLLCDNLITLYDCLSDDRRRKMIQDIQKHTQVLNDLIDAVLEISRLDSGAVSVERREVNLAQLAREEVGEQLPLAQEKAQALRVTGVERLAVWANDDQLRRVIRNLLNNAVKYTPDGGQITCECQHLVRSNDFGRSAWPGSADLPPGRWATLRVVDTGIGIGPDKLPHLFERFYRVKTQENVRGTGLGLSIAKELIELHSGRIAVASTLGEGSIFAIYLPLLEE